ncbi:hypothetical protein GQ43DRAFT_478816 [Delitschia confertaspora ATCC 74209]|uniref:F-box domain-containing protein n=1 Tax=Delitschia confertaspora ATCC 74209 TaxID=1513339 RepID=A0A9P4JR83_9PLEO|nr:hypothetical protein GQ43DRAFT_478816 [Delitschia confertaspora ATCC 74209]
MPFMAYLQGCFGWRPDQMVTAKEKTTLVWLWVCKIINIIFLGVISLFSRGLYRVIDTHPELHEPPYSRYTLVSQKWIFIAGLTAFVWTFVSFGALFKWKGGWILIHGIIDFSLGITLSVGAGLQASYLPSGISKCKASEQWLVDGDYPSFFQRFTTLNNDVSSDGVCRYFVIEWGLLITACFWQMLIAYVGIFFDGRAYSILNPWRPFTMFFSILIAVPYMVWISITPKICYAYHYLIKMAYRPWATKEIELEEHPPYFPEYVQFEVSNPRLQRILTIEHVLLNVVSSLHYDDIVNLSLTSKAVRESIFPARDMAYRAPKLKRDCCEKTTKDGCLYCNKRICDECKKVLLGPGLSGRRHAMHCRPCCKSCYRQLFKYPSRQYRPCKCKEPLYENQDVCGSCWGRAFGGDLMVLQKSRRLRYDAEVREKAMVEGLKCHKCVGVLDMGPRWWICMKCNGECRSRIHPSWLERKRATITDEERGD